MGASACGIAPNLCVGNDLEALGSPDDRVHGVPNEDGAVAIVPRAASQSHTISYSRCVREMVRIYLLSRHTSLPSTPR